MLRLHPMVIMLLLSALVVSACQPIQAPSPGDAIDQPAIFIQGSSIHGAEGITFDPTGNLWVAHLLPEMISEIDPATGAILTQFDSAKGIVAPSDLVFDEQGVLYWASWYTGVVGSINEMGKVSIIAKLLPGTGALVRSPEGRLFAASCGMDDSAIYEIYPEQRQSSRLIVGDLGDCAFKAGSWGPDGLLYGARSSTGEIVRVNVDSGEIQPAFSGLTYPVNVKFDAQGRLIVADSQTGEITRIDPSTGVKTLLVTLTPGTFGLALDAQDRLYVSNEIEGSIVEIATDDTLRIVQPAGLIFPGGIAITDDTLYVADFLSVRQFNRQSGEQVASLYRTTASELKYLLTVAIDGDKVLLTSWLSNTVQRLDPATHTIMATYDDFNVPLNAIAFQGDLIVAELGSGSVVRAQGDDPTQRETLVKDLAVPTGLAATERDLWVADMATGTIWQIIANGVTLPEPKLIAQQLAVPEGLAVTDDGKFLVVVEVAARRLSLIDLSTGLVKPLAEDLAIGVTATRFFHPTWIFNGVAIDEEGQVYVTSDKSNVIYRFVLPPE